MVERARWFGLATAVLVAGCSLLRNPSDFSFVDPTDGGRADATVPDGGMPECTEDSDCVARGHAVAACDAEACDYACEPDYGDCDADLSTGCETDTTGDLDHCGDCDTVCAFANAVSACADSTCEISACRTGFESCNGVDSDGCEADLTSVATCGGCAVACDAGQLCDSTGSAPVCSDTCSGTVCGTQCVDTTMHPGHCGACGTVCPVPAGAADATCVASACGFTCNAGRADCNTTAADGCEVNTTNDVANCGGCAMACDTTHVTSNSCDAGVCVVVACESGWGDCDADPATGCETDLTTDTASCGSCGNACDAGTSCRSGVCDPPVSGSVGGGHGCLVRESGRVFCWGQNDNHQAGAAEYPRALETAMAVLASAGGGAPTFTASQVAAGNIHTCAIDAAGELFCWGDNSLGQIGVGTSVEASYPTAVVASPDAALFDPRTFVDLDSYNHTCAIDDMGDIWCWGANYGGASGTPAGTAYNAKRVTSPGATAVDIAVGQSSSCAALADGRAVCWGTNTNGQLGNGDLTGINSYVPVNVAGVTNVVAVTGHWRTFCARSTAGALWCWGDNTSGQIGVRGGDEHSPVIIDSSGVLEQWQSLYSLCWRKSDGVRCQGRNFEGQYGNGTTTPRATNGEAPTMVPGLGPFRDVRSGRTTACGLSGVEYRCWGGSFFGSVPRASMQLEMPTPVRDLAGTALTGLTSFGHGGTHGCGIQTGRALCWGRGGQGELGDGTGLTEAQPIVVSTLTNVVDIAAGGTHSCAVEDLGPPTGTQAYCWGNNNLRAVGVASGNTAAPRLVELIGQEVAVETGLNHSCAITTAGAVHCWGDNDQGQLGRATTGTMDVPGAAIPGVADATDLALGGKFSCVLRSGATVSCFGHNDRGQLGDGTMTSRSMPAAVSGLSSVVEIAAGEGHACARLMSGQVRCWGAGTGGQLGDGAGVNRTTPVTVSYTAMAAVSIAAGEDHSCAAYADGSVRCWGRGSYYELGNGSTMRRTSPVVVPGLTNVTAVAAGTVGGRMTCALQGSTTPPGSVHCWGQDYEGAAGNGESLYFTPTRVVLP